DAVSTVPLVLHGGSGTPNNQIQDAVRNGICKINVYADSRVALWKSIKEAVAEVKRNDPLPKELFKKFRTDLGAAMKEKFELVYAVDSLNK
ncbi:MAG: class II fructose-bisphosphate aldolase, partial [Thermoguttaceae bacterium]